MRSEYWCNGAHCLHDACGGAWHHRRGIIEDLSQCEAHSRRSCGKPRPRAIDRLGYSARPITRYTGVHCARSTGMLTGRSVRRQAGDDPTRGRHHRCVVAGLVGCCRQPDVRTAANLIFTARSRRRSARIRMLTVAVLQLLPFAVGLAPEMDRRLRLNGGPHLKSRPQPLAVLALLCWQLATALALIGSRTLLAALSSTSSPSVSAWSPSVRSRQTTVHGIWRRPECRAGLAACHRFQQ